MLYNAPLSVKAFQEPLGLLSQTSASSGLYQWASRKKHLPYPKCMQFCFSKETTSGAVARQAVRRKSSWQSGGEQGQATTRWEPMYLSVTTSDYHDLQRITAASRLVPSIFAQVLFRPTLTMSHRGKEILGHSSQLNQVDPA